MAVVVPSVAALHQNSILCCESGISEGHILVIGFAGKVLLGILHEPVPCGQSWSYASATVAAEIILVRQASVLNLPVDVSGMNRRSESLAVETNVARRSLEVHQLSAFHSVEIEFHGCRVPGCTAQLTFLWRRYLYDGIIEASIKFGSRWIVFHI